MPADWASAESAAGPPRRPGPRAARARGRGGFASRLRLRLEPLHAEGDAFLAVVVGDLVGDAGVDAHDQSVLRAGLRVRLLGGLDGDSRTLDRAVRVHVAVGDEQRAAGE